MSKFAIQLKFIYKIIVEGDTMKFYIRGFTHNFTIPTSVVEFPSVVLMTDNWNDYGYETYFHVYYIYNSDAFEYMGACKICSKLNPTTRLVIPREFECLDENFCSLGQSVSYYETICKEGFERAKKILNSLNDTALNDDIRIRFKDEPAFKESLLRFSEAGKALKEAKLYFGESIIIDRSLNFRFEYKIPNATSPHRVDLNFSENDVPFRINCFVGKNATGKTRILTELASRLSGAKKSGNRSFTPERPSFSKIIAISYSAFDELYKPFEEEKNEKKQLEGKNENDETEDNNRIEDTILGSYVYCGLRNSKGLLTINEIEENFFNAYNKVLKREREQKWIEIMSNILEPEHLRIIDDIRVIRTKVASEPTNFLSSYLSSGQNIMLSTITEVIANIEVDSLLLFDEPELHLHPNAIANFMRMFYELLSTFNSYAILSTHSPLIIQEIPSKFVKLFNRSNNTPYITDPDGECFGENISVLTNDLFEVREHESNYKTWLKKMKEEGNSYDNIIQKFDFNLSYNAQTYLNALYVEEVE